MGNREFILGTLAIVLILNVVRPQSSPTQLPENFPEFLKEGHRGARGLMPENTIASMKEAIDNGANVLELDIQISKDKKVLVTHDPFINRTFSLLPDGTEIPETDSRKYRVYNMDYSQIRKFDVGSKLHPNFSEQQNFKAHIPLLGTLIDSVEQYTAEKGMPPVIYNIEIKSNSKKDGEYQPAPEEYVALVMDELQKKDIQNRFYVQSFDIRIIQEVHEKYPEVVIGFLTGNKNASFEENISKIGFYPHIYSPHYSMASEELIRKCHANNLVFVPWTVNSKEEMKQLMAMGVDGIITDFPNLLNDLMPTK